MLLNYKILFSVELLHEYFNKDVFADCEIVASAETKEYLQYSNLITRFIGNRLFVLVREDETLLLQNPPLHIPFAPLDTQKFFRFYIKCNNPNLFNYSNIDTGVGHGQLLYLSNLSNNVSGVTLHLTQPVPFYNASTVYHVGNLIRQTVTNNVFECIQHGVGFALNDATAWLPRNKEQFVSGADLVKLSPATYRYALPVSASNIKITIKGFHVVGNTLAEFDVLIKEESYPDPVKEISVDLSSLPFGRYKILVDADGVDVTPPNPVIYYDGNVQRLPGIGIIEIFNHLPAGDAYSMFDAAGNIIETNYTIQFASRYALWKYITQTLNVSNINTGVAGLSFTKTNKEFISNIPIQLKQIPDNSFVLEFSNSSPPDPIQAAFPSTALLKCQKEADNITIRNFFTEIYLNY